VLAAGLSLQVAFGLVFAWGAVVPLVRAQAHWPDLLLGAVFSATPLGYGIGTAVGGRLADRVPPRRLCWAALGLLAVGFAVTFSAPGGLTFVAAYGAVGLGLGGGVALTGAVAALAREVPGRAGAVGGLVSATYAASAIFQAPVLTALAPRLGWLGALEAVGAGAGLAAAAGLLLMPAVPAGTLGGGPAMRVTPAVGMGALLALCGAAFGGFAAVNLPGAVALFAAGNAGGRLLGGLIADRLGVRRVLAGVFALELAAAAALFGGVGAPVAGLAALAAGLAFGGDAGGLSRVGADAMPDRPNAAFGLVFAGFTVGTFSGPIAGALVGRPTAWLALAAPPAAGLALLAIAGVRRPPALSRGRAGGPGRGAGT
jgi:MFS family permease